MSSLKDACGLCQALLRRLKLVAYTCFTVSKWWQRSRANFEPKAVNHTKGGCCTPATSQSMSAAASLGSEMGAETKRWCLQSPSVAAEQPHGCTTSTSRTTDQWAHSGYRSACRHQVPPAHEQQCISWVTHRQGQRSRSCLCAGPSDQERHLDTQKWDAPTHGGCSQYFGSPVSPAASWGQALPVHQRPLAGCTTFPGGPIPVTAVSEDALKQTASQLVPRLQKRKIRWLQHTSVWTKEDVRFHFDIFHVQNLAEKLFYNIVHILHLVIDGYHNFCSC